jgi:peptidoglycan hydrolase-like protein with peptidoglycan-binding domain
MTRTLALASALLFTALPTGALMAQSSAPAKPAAPAMKHDSTMKSTAATPKSTTATTHHAAWTKDQIKEAQEGLTKAGLYKGKASGIFNADTRKALREYQKQNKLPVTGRLSDSVLAKLKTT